MKGSVALRPFNGLLILDVINWFISGYGTLIYYIHVHKEKNNIRNEQKTWEMNLSKTTDILP